MICPYSIFLIFMVVLPSLMHAGDVLDSVSPDLSKDGDLCVQKKETLSHSLFSDWLRVFHRYNTFQTYPQLTSSLLMDIKESDNQYVLHVDMPGIEKDKIKIIMSPNQQELQISAFKEGIKTNQGEEFKIVERVTGNLNRLVYLPESADVDKLRAKFDNGVLEITIPKLSKEIEAQRTRYIVIE